MYNGILLLNKKRDFTSHDVVAKLRGILQFRKIGHAGTLDPMAEGLLIMLLGNATRASEHASGEGKEYIAEFALGIETDTQDTTGTTLQEREVLCCEEDVREAVKSFAPGYHQLPPMYSALQKDGKRLYDLAREGQEVERETRFIEIPSIELLELDMKNKRGKMAVCCSKGTYIRTICHDLGQILGCGAAMSALTRTRIGGFFLEDALTLDEIEACVKDGNFAERVLDVDIVFEAFPKIQVTQDGEKRALNGAHLAQKHINSGEIPANGDFCRVYSESGKFLMVGKGGKMEIGPPAVFPHKLF